MRKLFLILAIVFLNSCYKQQHNCKDFKTGTFVFENEINGVNKTSKFIRTNNMEIETFEGKTDTSNIRWVNDCEYILEKKNPKNRAEQKAISIKILTTDKDGYTFEYGLVGSPKKQRGKIKKI